MLAHQSKIRVEFQNDLTSGAQTAGALCKILFIYLYLYLCMFCVKPIGDTIVICMVFQKGLINNNYSERHLILFYFLFSVYENYHWIIESSIKGRQSPKFALFFNLRNRISFKNLNEQKKPHQKILNFDEVMACQISPIFGPLKNELKFSRGI